MAYQFDINNLSDGTLGGAGAIFDLKELLKAAGWVIRASGGGTGSGLFGAASDVITTATLMNVNNAWFVIRQPASATPRREFMFQRGSAQTAWRCSFVTNGDTFTGGAPDEDTPPTGSADEAYLLGAATPTFVTLFGTAGTYRYHIGADDASPFAFFFFTIPNGGGAANNVMVFEPLNAADSLDADPAVYLFWDSGGSSDPFTETRMNSTTTGARGWFKADLAGETFTIFNGMAYHATPAIPGNLGTNPYDGDHNHFPIAWGRHQSVAQGGWKGFGTQMRWLATPRTDMDTLSTSGTIDKVCVGEIVLPWPNTVPIV